MRITPVHETWSFSCSIQLKNHALLRLLRQICPAPLCLHALFGKAQNPGYRPCTPQLSEANPLYTLDAISLHLQRAEIMALSRSWSLAELSGLKCKVRPISGLASILFAVLIRTAWTTAIVCEKLMLTNSTPWKMFGNFQASFETRVDAEWSSKLRSVETNQNHFSSLRSVLLKLRAGGETVISIAPISVSFLCPLYTIEPEDAETDNSTKWIRQKTLVLWDWFRSLKFSKQCCTMHFVGKPRVGTRMIHNFVPYCRCSSYQTERFQNALPLATQYCICSSWRRSALSYCVVLVSS